MRKLFPLIFFFLLSAANLHAQYLKIFDVSDNAEVTNFSITLQSPDPQGWVGFESLNLFLKVVNTGPGAVMIGAKKIELDTLQPDVQHTICYAGSCLPPTTFVSPDTITFAPSASDSSFSGHYLFDNTVHIRGINHVKYVFYDVNNPNDSVFVNVTYNTNAVVGINNTLKNDLLYSFPNPADGNVIFERSADAIGYDTFVVIYQNFGENNFIVHFPANETKVSFNTSYLPAGMYFYHFSNDLSSQSARTMFVIH